MPKDGETRLLILKTYRDPKSYFAEGATIVFSRSLGIKRNSVVLPPGYELVSLNVPSQVLSEADGRAGRQLHEPGTERDAPRDQGAEAAAMTRATLIVILALAARPSPPRIQRPGGRLSERARQDREIVYFLNPPETHSFDLYHDYTEAREGVDKYLNVVRKGSTASEPPGPHPRHGREPQGRDAPRRGHHARPVSTCKARSRAGPARHGGRGHPIRSRAKGGSVRLRISETYTDPGRYRLEGDELVFDRSLGRPRNAIVLPGGLRRSPPARSRPRSRKRRTAASGSTS